MMRIEYISTILEIIEDSKEHGISEIKNNIPLNIDTLSKMLDFLYEEGFILKFNDKLRISSKGLEFLRLP